MNELVVFPDVVDVLRTALLARLPEVGQPAPVVVGKVPAQLPHDGRFVRILRTGGVSQDVVIDRAMVTVESWAPTDKASIDLAQAARAVVLATQGAVVSAVTVYSVVEFSGPANVPDPVSRSPRHTQTFEVCTRGSAV